MNERYIFQRLIALCGISLMLLLVSYPTIFNSLYLIEIVQAQNTDETQSREDQENESGVNTNTPENEMFPSILQRDGQVKFQSSIIGAATSPVKRLNIDPPDRVHFEDYFTLERYIKTRQDLQGKTSIDLNDLPQNVRDNLNLDYISTYDRRLISSILNIVTPENGGGAGHELLEIERITKGHRTEAKRQSTEAVPPPEEEDEEPRPTQHHKDFGKAVDVSAIDYLRGTEFELEVEVDDKGNPKTDSKGRVKYMVVNKVHKPLKAIEVGWQTDVGTGDPSKTGKILGKNPHQGGQLSVGNQILAFILDALERDGRISLDSQSTNLEYAQNIVEITKELGNQKVAEDIFENDQIQIGKNNLSKTGQAVLGQVTGLPAYGFWGETLDGSAENTPGLLINLGREIVTDHLALPTGSLLGTNSNEILASVGKRVFEEILGSLPVGTLDAVKANNKVSLEVTIGRGVVAKFFDLAVRDIPLESSLADFRAANPLMVEYIEQNPILIETAMGLSGTGATTQLVSGVISPDAWMQKIGSARLDIAKKYSRPDTAFNLEERPELNENLKNLPAGVSSDSNDTIVTTPKITAIKDRAGWLLDQFSFTEQNTALLTQAKNLSPVVDIFSGQTHKAREFLWMLNDDELKAWLVDTAFVKGFDFSLYPRTGRFLSADLAVFKEVGIDKLAKILSKDNRSRQAIRHYLRNDGTVLTDSKGMPLFTANELAGRAGLRSKVEFDAIFINNAPSIPFETIGRSRLLISISNNKEFLTSLAAKDGAKIDTVLERLDKFKAMAMGLKTSLPTNQRYLIEDEVITDIESLKSFIENTYGDNSQSSSQITNDQVVDVLIGLTDTTTWQQKMETFYRVGHAAAQLISNSDQKVYRQYATSLAVLTHGVSGEEIYNNTNLSLNHPKGRLIKSELIQIIGLDQSPNEGIKKIGGIVLDDFLGTDENTAYRFFSSIDRLYQNGTTKQQLLETTRNFAKANKSVLYDLARSLGLRSSVIDGSFDNKVIDLAEQMASTLLFPTSLKIKQGANLLDSVFGTANYSTGSSSGFLGIITGLAGPDIEPIIRKSQSWRSLTELILGRSVSFTNTEQSNPFESLKILWGSRSTGFTWDPNIDRLIDLNGGPFDLMKRLTGQTIEQLINDIEGLPFIGNGQKLEDYELIWRQFIKDSVFDGSSGFWQNQQYLNHLQTIATETGIPGITVDVIKAIFDKNTSSQQLGQLFSSSFNQFFGNRLSFTSDLFGLDNFGFDLSGLISTIANPGLTDATKGAALEGFGTAIVDSYLASHFGFNVGWIFDDRTSSETKITLGMQMLSNAFNLDPSISNLVGAVYETFFVTGGIDTSTSLGRQNLSRILGAVGQAGNIPAEYTLLASSIFTGDLETTLLSYAGQGFIDQKLLSIGISDIGLGDFISAYISPLGTGNDFILGQTWDSLGLYIQNSAVSSQTGITVTSPNGEVFNVNQRTKDVWDKEVGKFRSQYQQKAQQNLQYALMDRVLFLGFDKQIPGLGAMDIRGMSRAMFEGNPFDKLSAFTGFLGRFAGTESSEILWGVQAAKDLVTFFETKNFADIPTSSLANIDGWFRQVTGWTDAPVGTFTAVLDFAKTGTTTAFDSLLKSDYTQFQLSGFVDNALGLPQGTAFTAWQAYETFTTAQNAFFDAAKDLAKVSPTDFAGIKDAANLVNKRYVELQFTTASIVSTGVNLIFGKTFAQLDQSFGLPSGTVSMVVNAVIYSILVPGIGFVQVLASIIAPALGGMLLGGLLGGGGILGGLFGSKKKTVKRKVVLWSYTLKNDLEKPKQDRPTEQVLDPTYERGKWPEEIKFIDPDNPEGDLRQGNDIAIIALYEPEKLPQGGLFLGNTGSQYQAGIKRAANDNLIALIGDLLTLDDRFENEDMLPLQIMTHKKEHVEHFAKLITNKYGLDNDREFGTYSQRLKDTDQRKGVVFDTTAALLTKWIHWQY